jgi:hypothetical protein
MKTDLRHSTFPILPLRPDEGNPPRVFCDPAEQGSTFFISRDGLFLTATHVVDKWSVDSYAVIALDFRLKAKKDCRVLELERHPEMDIAIGRAEEPGQNGWPSLTLSGSRIGNGSAVLFYGYANTEASPRRDPYGRINLDDVLTLNLDPRPHLGHVVEHLVRGPRSNGPCYHVNCDPGGGISGGPLIRKRTQCVHGIFNTAIPGSNESGPASGFALDLAAVLTAWRIHLLEERTLREYADKYPGRVSVR